MADIETVAEQAGASAAAIVEGAVASVEGAVEAVEARAEAAEAALEVLADAAHRDALHDEIEEVTEEVEEWQSEHAAVHEQLNQRITSLETLVQNLQAEMLEISGRVTVLTVSTPPASETLPDQTAAPAPVLTATTINPADAPAPMPVAPVVPARGKARPWI